MKKDFDFMDIKVKLNKKVYSGNYYLEQKINFANINDEILKQSGKYAWWASLYSMMAEKEDKLKVMLKRLYSVIALEIRTKKYALLPSKDSEGKPFKLTDKAIDELISCDPEYVALEDEYFNVKKISSKLKCAKIAFEQRKDMLQTYSSNIRGELDRINTSDSKEILRDSLKESYINNK